MFWLKAMCAKGNMVLGGADSLRQQSKVLHICRTFLMEIRDVLAPPPLRSPHFWALIHVKTHSLQTIIVKDIRTSKAAYQVKSTYQDKLTDVIILPEDSACRCVARGVQDPLNAMQWRCSYILHAPQTYCRIIVTFWI